MKTRKILFLGIGHAREQKFFDVASMYPENFRDIPGHEIITFGYNEGVDIRIDHDDDFENVIRRLPAGWTPDYCLMINLMWNLLPRGIEKAPFPTVYLSLDWDLDVPISRTNAEAVDLQIVGGEYAQETVRSLGANNVEIFYDCGVMREVIPPFPPKKIKDREYDIFYTSNLFGTPALDRVRFRWISKLCELGDKYNYNVLIVPRIQDYRQYLQTLQNSKLALSHNRDGHLSFRVIEAGSQGTVIMDTGAQIKKYFVPEEEYIPINEDNFFEKVHGCLQDKGRLQSISDRFHAKIKKEFESRTHIIKLIDLAERALRGRKLERKYSRIPEHEQMVRRGELYYFLYFRGVKDGFIQKAGHDFLERSMKDFRRAIALEPGAKVRTDLAVATASFNGVSVTDSMMKELQDDTIDMLNDIISSYPAFAVAHFNLGLTHLRVGNNEEALSAFSNTLAVLRSKDAIIEPWCLYSREFDDNLTAYPIGRSLDKCLHMLCRGEGEKAIGYMRDIYQAAALYYMYGIEESKGNIHRALELILESYELNPESAKATALAAGRLALLGHLDESLSMYRKAIQLAPVDIDLRIDYIRLLYYFGKDRETLEEIKSALKLTRAFTALKSKAVVLGRVMKNFSRLNTETVYSYDGSRETLLNNWLEQLYIVLGKDPGNLNIVLRIAEIYDELGRLDGIFELMDEYTGKYLNGNTPEDHVLAIKHVYDYLEKAGSASERVYKEKLNRLNSLISGMQKMGVSK
ncbi:MAG: hypothetical protein HZA16_14315 [Nitrospirae bacterium]|nr:hypothetical protein [Nitrospirota bacterium]